MTGPVARADAAVDPTWKDARDHQPQGLHLKMTLKALFHLPGQTFDKSNEITFTVADSIH
jgi:hypothetical protein